jgi:hypothetical protein
MCAVTFFLRQYVLLLYWFMDICLPVFLRLAY